MTQLFLFPACILLGTFFVLVAFTWGCKGEYGGKDEAAEQGAGHRKAEQNTPGVVTLDPAAQRAEGIAVESLRAEMRRKEIAAYGRVLDISALMDSSLRYAEAKARLEKDKAFLEASRREYERLKALFKDRRNVSRKRLDEAEAAWRSAKANVGYARTALRTLELAARQRWGNVLAGWLVHQSRGYRLLAGSDALLLQVTLPPRLQMEHPPGEILLRGAGTEVVKARLVSPVPFTDPRVQGHGFFYILPSRRSGLTVGMNVKIMLPVGNPIKGVVIPRSAIFWLEGSPWVWVQHGPNSFTRCKTGEGFTVSEGLFVIEGVPCGSRVVVKGAQLLLSREFLGQQVSGGGEEED